MKRLILTALLALLTVVTPAVAQQAGTNVNVLPVIPESSGDPDWFLKGDGYLQRQVEPSIAASTLNPEHLIACFNDYRAVDVSTGDTGLGEGEITSAALKLARILLPPEIVSGLPKGELVPPINAAEAWIGCSRSYDGGYTWSGFYLPGAPAAFYEEGAPPTFSTEAPIYGLDAATDPVLTAGPCGRFYLVFVAFTRGGESKIGVATFRDTNAFEGGDTIVYEGMEIIESGNNAEFGYFLDKPDIDSDILRPLGADQCEHRVYVTYSTFNGLTKDEKVQTKLNFAVSEATNTGPLSFSKTKINKNFGQNQGSAIAVDPRPGVPGRTGGGGTVYVFWRHFFDPDAIIWTRTVDYGNRWSNPAILTTSPALEPFDQPTISLGLAPVGGSSAVNPGFPELGFRSNGFPTASVAPYLVSGGDPDDPDDWNATLFAAWQERVGPTSKQPDANGLPQIVMMRTDADAIDWEGFDSGGDYQASRQAIDLFDRFDAFDPYFLMPPDAPDEPRRDPGPQVQPKLSFGGGRLMLTFYESRGRIANYGTALEYLETNRSIVDQTGWISGYDRVVDFRTALLEPATGERLSAAQISRYPIRFGAILSNGQQLSDVAAVNFPCFPDSGDPDNPICVRQVNRANAPTSAEGSSPFIGDYPDTVPYIQFVPEEGGGWRWAIRPTDVPNRGFHAIWTDNRHLMPPPGPDEWDGYSLYGPPGIEGACFNPGSRNTDVLTSRVATDVLVSAPTTYKQLDRPRSFPFSISNTTGEFRRFTLRIASDLDNGTEFATFSPKKQPDGEPVNLDTYSVIVFPYSNSSLTVYVYPPGAGDQTTAVGTILVEVSLVESTIIANDGTDFITVPWPSGTLCTEDCLVGTISFNAYPGNEPVENIAGRDEDFGPEISNAFVINWQGSTSTTDPNTAFVINNFLDNAFVINTSPDNAFVINDGLDNAFVINTEVQNAFVINRSSPVVYGISDTVWTMTPGTSNTAASYVPLINIDNAKELEGYYAWQLVVDKNSAYGSAAACEEYASNINQQQVLANVVQNPEEPNAFVINDFVENAFVINTEVQNAFVINSAFTLPPSGGGGGAKAGGGNSISALGIGAPPAPNEVKITLRAFQLVPDDELPIDDFTGNRIKHQPEISAPTLTVFHEACDPADVDDICYATAGADLIIAPGSIDTTPLSVPTCGDVPLLDLTLRNQGNTDAVARPKPDVDGDGNQIFVPQRMRHAVFLSTDETLTTRPLKDENGNVITEADRLLAETEFFSAEFRLAAEFDPDRDPSEPFEEDFVFVDQDNQRITFKLPSDVDVGLYYLFYYVDYPREASEYDETNNTAIISLAVTAVEPPGATDADFETDQGVPLSASVANSVVNPNMYEPLAFAVKAPPSNGSVQLDVATGAFIYTPNPTFVGTDSFDWTVSYCNVTSDPATVTIEVINPAWGFVGLLTPWKPDYTANAGSAVPLKWYYTDPQTGVKIDSSMAEPQIRIKGPWVCSVGETGNTIEFVNDPGSSNLRYNTGDWQFNWDTVGLGVGCYNVRIYHPYTGQIDGPFGIELK